MKSIKELEVLQDVMNSELGVESQVEALKDIINNILDEGAFRARVIRFKVQNYINSTDPYERLYGLSKIVSEGKGLSEVPTEETINEALEDVCAMISDAIARRYVQNKIEKEVEQFLMEKKLTFTYHYLNLVLSTTDLDGIQRSLEKTTDTIWIN